MKIERSVVAPTIEKVREICEECGLAFSHNCRSGDLLFIIALKKEEYLHLPPDEISDLLIKNTNVFKDTEVGRMYCKSAAKVVSFLSEEEKDRLSPENYDLVFSSAISSFINSVSKTGPKIDESNISQMLRWNFRKMAQQKTEDEYTKLMKRVGKNFEALEQTVSSFCAQFESNNISVEGDIYNDKIIFYVTNKLVGKIVRVLGVGKEDGIRYMSDHSSPLTLETQILIEEEILNAFKAILSMRKKFMNLCKKREAYIVEENKIKGMADFRNQLIKEGF